MSSPSISFDSIPSGIRKPGQYVEFNTRLAVNSLPANVQKLILIGQKLKDAGAWANGAAVTVGMIKKPTTANGHLYFCVTAGTTGGSEPTWPTTVGGEVTDGTAIWKEFQTDIPLVAQLTTRQLFSSADAALLAGTGSMIHLMAQEALQANPYLNLFAIAIDDAAGVNATGTWTVTGTPTGTGFVRCWIGDDYVEISYASADTPTSIATAIKNAIAANANLPVVAKSVAGLVTATFKHAGTLGNQVSLAVEFSTSGNLNVVASGMANGTTDPDFHAIGSVLDKIAPDRFHLISLAYNDATSIGYIKTHLDFVSGPREKRGSVCFIGLVDTLANIQTRTAAAGHGRIVAPVFKADKTPAWLISAGIASVKASVEDPAMPLNNMKVPGIAAADISNRWTRTEQETLLLSGATPLDVDSAGNVTIVRMITTYQSDISFLDVTTICTLDYVRDAICDRIRLRFGQSKLNDRVALDVRSEIIVVLKQLEALQIIENVDANLAGVLVERDTQDPNRLDAKIPADVVNGLHVFAGRIDLIL